MAVSKAVRMALKRAGKQNRDLAQLWGYTINAVSNKFSWERWTGKELSEVAELTGGRLAFIYPDGTQIMIVREDPKATKAAAKPKKAKAQAKAQVREVPSGPQEKRTPSKPKEEKKPDVLEKQISIFDLV